MKPSRLTLAALVMAALGGFLWWSNEQEDAKAKEPAKGTTPKILELKEDAIQQIEIKPREGAATVVKKTGPAQWTITAPNKLAADSAAVMGVVGSATSLASDRVVDENAGDLAPYGLKPALSTITFSLTDGKTTVLHIGDPTPTGNTVYAAVDGDKRLFTMATSFRDAMAKSANDLREKHLLTFDQDKLSRVELMPAGKPPLEFGRTGQNEWQILKPRPLRADGFQVEDLLGKLKQVSMNADTDAKAAAAGFASAPAVATIRVTGPDGTKSIEIHKSKDDVYAKSSAMDGVYKVAKDAADGLEKSLDDFRAKKIFDFGFTDPGKLELKDGARTLAVEKSGDKWKSGGKDMDSVGVQNLIDKLRDLSAAKFVDSGFTTPAIEISVVSSEGKRTEKVQIAPAGDAFIAKREGDPSLYQLSGDVVRDLRQSIDGVREPAPPSDGKDGKKK